MLVNSLSKLTCKTCKEYFIPLEANKNGKVLLNCSTCRDKAFLNKTGIKRTSPNDKILKELDTSNNNSSDDNNDNSSNTSEEETPDPTPDPTQHKDEREQAILGVLKELEDMYIKDNNFNIRKEIKFNTNIVKQHIELTKRHKELQEDKHIQIIDAIKTINFNNIQEEIKNIKIETPKHSGNKEIQQQIDDIKDKLNNIEDTLTKVNNTLEDYIANINSNIILLLKQFTL